MPKTNNGLVCGDQYLWLCILEYIGPHALSRVSKVGYVKQSKNKKEQNRAEGISMWVCVCDVITIKH